MRCVLSACVVLLCSIAALGQQTWGDSCVTNDGLQPDATGQRLQSLCRAAGELELAGHRDQAATVHQQAEQERAALLSRLDALQIEAEQIRHAVGNPTQVRLQLQVFEVSLTKLRALGFDFQQLKGVNVVNDGSGIHGTMTVAKDGEIVNVAGEGNALPELLEALRKDKLAKVLAEPTLMTVSGKPVSFHVGGEVPVPNPQPDSSPPAMKPYGTIVNWTPEVLGDRVRMTIRGEVSELDPAHPVQVGEATVPGVHALNFDTQVEMRSGETLVLTGPTKVRIDAERHGVPWVSDVPIAGALFRYAVETQNETGTFIVMRTEILQPSAARTGSVIVGPQDEDSIVPSARPVVCPVDVRTTAVPQPAGGNTRR